MTPEVTCHDLDGMFESPHDAPPKWLCVLSQKMYTAYLDETGIHANDWIFIAGFLGKKEHWDSLIPRWKIGLGQRKKLHMHKLRWSKPSTEKLLARLGPIPKSCGLRPVVGGVKYSDYQDLVEGTIIQKSSQGYFWCMLALVQSIIKSIPQDERVELIFASQSKYQEQALSALSAIDNEIITNPKLHECRTLNGMSKLAKYGFTSYESTSLLEPADYYASAMAHRYIDATSHKAQWSNPILEELTIGCVFSREQVRGYLKGCQERMLPEVIRLGLTWNVSSEQKNGS
jgi:hypothetical protein